MKKLFSLLLCLAMLTLPVLGLAEASTLEYANENGYYSFAYPDTWTLLSPENVEEIFEAGQTMLKDEALLATLESARTAVEQYGMTMLMAPDYTTNINILAQTIGSSLSASDILSMSSAFITPISDALTDFTILNEAAVLPKFGENELVGFAYSYKMENSELYGAQFYICPKTELIVLTFTCPLGQQDAYTNDLATILSTLSF